MSDPRSDERSELFLPDFCGIRVVFAVVVVGELLAIVLTLSPLSGGRGGFMEMALASLFIQWVALGSGALLCYARRVFERLGNVAAAGTSYLMILAVTLVVSEVAWWLVLPRIDELVLAAPVDAGAGERAGRIEFALRNLGIAAVVALVALRYLYVQHQWNERMSSETRARIQALQSRIRPHFLFNSMNTIASLARSDPALAEQVTEDLAALFRVSLGDASEAGTLEQELEVCRQYLRIEAQRLGERLVSETNMDGVPGDALLPPLTLQPLVENAVYHGVEPAPDGGRIVLRGELDGATVRVRVENSMPRGARAGNRQGNAMALDNVRQRVEAFFGGEARMQLSSDEARFRVELEFPYRTAAR